MCINFNIYDIYNIENNIYMKIIKNIFKIIYEKNKKDIKINDIISYAKYIDNIFIANNVINISLNY